jgi:hypothetical protein
MPAIAQGICLSGTRSVAITVAFDRADQAWMVAYPSGFPFNSVAFGASGAICSSPRGQRASEPIRARTPYPDRHL